MSSSLVEAQLPNNPIIGFVELIITTIIQPPTFDHTLT
jgi:hypothetical protein